MHNYLIWKTLSQGINWSRRCR